MLIGYLLGAFMLFGFTLMVIVAAIILLSLESMTFQPDDPTSTTGDLPPVEIAP